MLCTLRLVTFIAPLVAALPTETLDKRSSSTCAQYGELEDSSFTVFNNLWGEKGASSGSQCTTLNGLSGSSLSWSTSWTWSGGNGIKSYANAGLGFSSTQLSKISSIDTTWQWSYSGSSIVADVAYDTFTSASAGGSNEYEVMVWMEALGGAKPISSAYTSSGQPVIIASPTIGAYQWNLYKGPNGDTTVFSFLPASVSSIENFNGNLMSFYTYLIDSEGLPSSQYLTTLQAGTEATSGSDAVFSVSHYSISVTG